MRQFFLFFHLSAALMAAGPEYFSIGFEATYLSDLTARGKLVFTPGTLSDCATPSISIEYKRYECKVADAVVELTLNGKTIRYPMDKVRVSEYQFDSARPAVLHYLLTGVYKETLLDGTDVELGSSFQFQRTGTGPQKIHGDLGIGLPGLSGAFLASIK